VTYLLVGGSTATATSGETEALARKSPAQAAAALPPTKPLAQTIALRIRRQIAPRQAHLNGQIRLLVADVTPLQSTVAGARALERSLAQTQNWLTRLEPHSSLDRSVLRSARATFARHRAYAAFIAGLPGSAVSLPRSDVAQAVARADAVRQSYVLLHEVAPSIPVVPIPPGVHRRLNSFVTAPTVPSPAPVVTAPGPSAAPPASLAADEQAIRDVVAAHWQAINASDYGRAYSYFSPTFKSRNSASGWIADKNVDRPTSSGLSFGGVSVSGYSATVYVSFRTRGYETSAGNTGCNAWSGSYSMTKVGAAWTIEKSHLNRTSLDCSTYVG